MQIFHFSEAMSIHWTFKIQATTIGNILRQVWDRGTAFFFSQECSFVKWKWTVGFCFSRKFYQTCYSWQITPREKMVYGLRLTWWNARAARTETPFPMVGVQILNRCRVNLLVILSHTHSFYFRVYIPFSSRILLKWFCFTRPDGMSRNAIFPINSSSYTSWDGKIYDAPCTKPGAAALETDQGCPNGFVPPRDDSDPRNCIKVVSSPHSIFFQIHLCSFPHARVAVLFFRSDVIAHSRVPSMRIRQKSTLSCGSSRQSYLL